MPFYPDVKPIDAYNAAILDTVNIDGLREITGREIVERKRLECENARDGQPSQDQTRNLRDRRPALQEGLRRGQRRQHHLPRQRKGGGLHADA